MADKTSDQLLSERTSRLRAVPLFARLDDATVTRILDCATEFEAPAGQVLAEARMAGSGLFVIEEGVVVVEVPGHPFDLGPGDFFGELSLLTDHERTARVRAKTPSRLLAIARHDFDDLLEEAPKLAIAMLRGLAKRLTEHATH